jgi:acetylornithine deacetylase
MNKDLTILEEEAIALLIELIATPSFSRGEDQTAGILCRYIGSKIIPHFRIGNNVFALSTGFDNKKPSILLNSHHDTVKPNKGYTLDPFSPLEKDGKLFGLGSNDAGGCLVALVATFLYFYGKGDMKYNLVLAATAEEEISGTGGIEALLQHPSFLEHTKNSFRDNADSFAIVGEPTLMQMAVAERGLLVLDCTSHGKAGHAAREEGENAIYNALNDIEWIRNYRFPKISPLLGPVKMSVTVIETDNKAHNVVPARCQFVVDSRVNELYSFEEVIDIIQSHVSCEIKPRSTRMRSTSISVDHPVVKAGRALGRSSYGSPTTSDKALMPFPSLKIGPGDSARSHMADEYIFTNEIREGIRLYVQLLNQLV